MLGSGVHSGPMWSQRDLLGMRLRVPAASAAPPRAAAAAPLPRQQPLSSRPLQSRQPRRLRRRQQLAVQASAVSQSVGCSKWPNQFTCSCMLVAVGGGGCLKIYNVHTAEEPNAYRYVEFTRLADTLNQRDWIPVPCRMTAAAAAAVMGNPVVPAVAAAVAAKKPTTAAAAAAALTNSSGSSGHVRRWQPWRWRPLLRCHYHWRKTPVGVSQQRGLASV